MSGVKKNIAVIGCGSWGKNLIRNFHELGVLAAINAHHLEAAHAIADQIKVPVMTQDDIIKDADIEGVVIATPSNTHYEIADMMLKAGKHVFIEKPMVTTIEDGEALEKLAAEQGKQLMVGHLLLYHPGYLKSKEIITSGKLGAIRHISSSRLSLGKLLAHENIIWDCAPHDISMILDLFNDMPHTVTATGSQYVVPPHEDKAHITLSFAGNRNAMIHLSRLHPFKEQKVVVIGSEGMLVFDDTLPWDQKVAFYKSTAIYTDGEIYVTRGEAEYQPLPESEPLRLECEHFVACVNNNQQPRTTARDALQGMRILLATDRSLNAMKSVSLEG